MNINLIATKKKFEESGRKFRAYAAARGLNVDCFSKFMAGRWMPKDKGILDLYEKILREDGLFVEEEAEKEDLSAA